MPSPPAKVPRQISVSLSDDEVAQLDHLADVANGGPGSRSELVRGMIVRALRRYAALNEDVAPTADV